MKKPTDFKKLVSAVRAKRLGIEPLGDRVFIRAEEPIKKTASGIIIPDTARQENPDRGVVVAVGPGSRGDDNEIIPVSVKVGDNVIFVKGYEEAKAKEEEIDGQKYYLVSESNVLAIIK